jgi:glycosyltransferase involved in cell wall biosynthesis
MAYNQKEQTHRVASPAIRHCMVVHNYYPLDETRVKRQAEALVNRGYEVDVICLRHGDEPSIDNVAGVTIHRLPVRRNKKRGPLAQLFEYLSFLVLAFLKLTALHRRQRYSVVQVHNLPDFLVFVALIPKLTGSRVILDIHDLMPEFYASRFNTTLASWPVRLVCWQEWLACRFADHVITVSDHWRQTLIKRGVPAQKCSVVMNVADERIFHASADTGYHAPNHTQFRLIYHGTIVERYGLDLAIQAIDQVRQDIPHIHLTILGKGEYVDTLIQMTQELQLNQHVTIYNEIRPPEELPAIIRRADVGIVPYRNDPFTDQLLPTKLMEYAALGLPAIAARTTAIDAYFRNTMVELFEPGDINDLAQCIRTLYTSPERLAELAAGSRKFNERYNWTKIGAAYVALVEQLNCR